MRTCATVSLNEMLERKTVPYGYKFVDGNVVKGGSDRYMKIAGQDWTYIVPSYSVDKFLPKPPPEPKKDEKK